jgi:hypothetical protein
VTEYSRLRKLTLPRNPVFCPNLENLWRHISLSENCVASKKKHCFAYSDKKSTFQQTVNWCGHLSETRRHWVLWFADKGFENEEHASSSVFGILIGMHPACPLSTLYTNAGPCGRRKLSGEDFLRTVPGSPNGDKLPRLTAKTYRGPAYSTHLWRKTLKQQCVVVCRQYKSSLMAKSACAPPPHTVFHSVRTLVELRRIVPSLGVRGRYLVQGVSGDWVLVYKR